MPAGRSDTADSRPDMTGLLRGMMLVGFVVPLAVALMFFLRAIEGDIARTSLLEQNCQTSAIRWQIPDREAKNAAPRAVTNCHRLTFSYLFANAEPINDSYRFRRDLLHATDSKGRRDFVVQVEHVQPATSLSDTTIGSRPNAYSFAGRLQKVRASIDGVPPRADGKNFDRFAPARPTTPGADLHFLGKPDAQPEFVGMCHFTGTCQVLAFSAKDGFAFAVTFSRDELDRVDAILQRTLALLRKWRVS